MMDGFSGVEASHLMRAGYGPQSLNLYPEISTGVRMGSSGSIRILFKTDGIPRVL